MQMMATSVGCRQSLLVARDELELNGPGPSSSSPFSSSSGSAASTSNSSSNVPHGHGGQQPLEGPLSTLRRSLRQMNPFKSRLFRLPATPRLSRSKKVLGRGEDFTGWNFARPVAHNCGGSSQSSACNSLRPLSSSSFGPADFEYHPGNAENGFNVLHSGQPQQQRRFSQFDGPFQQSPMQQRKVLTARISGPDQCSCCGHNGGGEMEGMEGFDDLDQFLSAMESIARRGQVGGSCRLLPTSGQQSVELKAFQRGTVAGPPPPAFAGLPGPGTKRARPPIPSFNPPWPAPPALCPPNTNANMANGKQHFANGNTQMGSQKQEELLHFLPSTCYSPNGEMFAARWRPGQAMMASSQIGSPRLPRQRPQPLYLPEQHAGIAIGNNNNNQQQQQQQQEPKSPSQSTITLLNTQLMAANGMRSASTVSSASVVARQKQPRPQMASAAALFPQTQLQRRQSACSAASAAAALDCRNGRDKSIAEEEGEEEAAANGSANYYGRDVLRLLDKTLMSGLKEDAGEKESPSLLPSPQLLFPLEEQLFAPQIVGLPNEQQSGEELFIGREWLFKELCQQLLTERAQMVLLLGASGTGKSAIARQLLLHSPFCDHKLNGQQTEQQQHNTVDSGIAVSAGSGGGNSSGSQLSLLNVSGHVPPEPTPCSPGLQLSIPNRCASPTPSTGGRNYEWLRTLGRHICAFHFAHLHSAESCSVVSFIRSICAQLCQCPQLKHSYGKIIRSSPMLHRLAVDENAALNVEPIEMFRQLVLQPIGQFYAEEEKRRKERRAAKRSSSRGSDYGGSNSGSADRQSAQLPPFVLVLVDALDESGFHRTDGGESIGWLLRRTLPECPPQLRFLCTLAPGPGPLREQSAIFGTLADDEKPVEARSIRLDDWELDERVGRDARLFVEAKVRQSPALEKWVNAQFRRQSFFAASPPSAEQNLGLQLAQQANLAEFSAQLVHRMHANFTALHLALGLLAEGRILSLGALSADLGQLYALHFRHRFNSSAHFQPLANVLAVLLASLRPLDFEELLAVLNAAEETKIEPTELKQWLAQLSPWVCQLPASGHLVPAHPSLRDWLLKEGATEFGIDVRHGHILLALSSINGAMLCLPNQERLFELSHHLLKANPHKYMHQELASRLGMPQTRDAQVQWLRLAGAEAQGLANALLYRRNIFYPNSKVSRLLLLAGADPNANRWPDGSEEPLLCAFSRAGNAEMLQLLLQFGANPNFGSPPPLVLAIRHGHEQVARQLVSVGADLNAKDAAGKGALWHAAANDSLAMLGFLLDAIGEATTGEKNGEIEATTAKAFKCGDLNPRYSACSSSGYEEMPNTQNGQHFPNAQNGISRIDRSEAIREAFECAAERGSARVCRFLLDCTDAVLDTSRAMCIACANGRSEVVQFLLSRGATLAPEHTWNGKSALLCAVESGSWDLVVNVLNVAGPAAMQELNAMSGPDRLSPLMVAARHGHVGLVDLLVNRGAHLDAADAHGRTAVMHAIEAGHVSTVGLLLERGCGALHARDGHGNTLLHLLARHPSKCLINRLLEAGLSLEEKNREDLRPIEVALQCGQLPAVDAFLRRGARLRSLTWQIALASNPPLVLVLLRKLLDDAQILLRRKRTAEAQHRFAYALQKCDELLAKADGPREGTVPEGLSAIVCQLRRYKVQALHSLAALKRRANDIHQAIGLANEALDLLNAFGQAKPNNEEGPSPSSEEEAEAEESRADNEQRFELHLLRAKCHFDARDLARARMDAQLAACLRPGDQEAQSLLAVLSMG